MIFGALALIGIAGCSTGDQSHINPGPITKEVSGGQLKCAGGEVRFFTDGTFYVLTTGSASAVIDQNNTYVTGMPARHQVDMISKRTDLCAGPIACTDNDAVQAAYDRCAK
jgi:hypothetical protein